MATAVAVEGRIAGSVTPAAVAVLAAVGGSGWQGRML